jgi:hypothetical protein
VRSPSIVEAGRSLTGRARSPELCHLRTYAHSGAPFLPFAWLVRLSARAGSNGAAIAGLPLAVAIPTFAWSVVVRAVLSGFAIVRNQKHVEHRSDSYERKKNDDREGDGVHSAHGPRLSGSSVCGDNRM